MEPSKSIAPILIAIVALVVVGGGALVYFNKNTDTSATTTADGTKETTTPASTSDDTSTNTSGYKDGTYTAVGSYRTPETTEQLTVTLTLKDGVVTNANVVGDPQAPETTRFQSQFIANYKQFVIGKNINTLSLSHISGSSLTSTGFNSAVVQIKTEAKS